MKRNYFKLGMMTMTMCALSGVALADEAGEESTGRGAKVSFPIGTNPVDENGDLILGAIAEYEEKEMDSSNSEVEEGNENEATKDSASSSRVEFPTTGMKLDENGVPIFGPSITNEDGSPRYIFPLKDTPVDKDGNAELKDPLDYRRSFPNNTVDMIIKKYSEEEHDPREEPVRNMAQKPFHSILYLLLKRADEDRVTEQCTGTVIGKNTVLTAGHCVASDAEVSDGTVMVGTIALPSQMGRKHDLTFEIEESIAHPIWLKGWREPNRFDYDVAVLKTRPNAEGKHIGEVLEKLPLKVETGSQLGWEVSTPGYPTRTIEEYGLNLWNITGKIVKEYDEIYKTDFVTSVGQSGAPLLNSKNEVIGTLSYGNHETSGYIRMRPEIYDWIQEHMVQFEESIAEKKGEHSLSDKENAKKPQQPSDKDGAPSQIDKPMAAEADKEKIQIDKGMILEENRREALGEAKSVSDDSLVTSSLSKTALQSPNEMLPRTGTANNGPLFGLLCGSLALLGYGFYRRLRPYKP